MPEQQRASRGVAFRRPAPVRSLVSRACPLLMLFAASLAQAATFTGRVFEDVNYGGGAGRSFAASNGVGSVGVRVELYRVSNNNFITSGVTGAGGVYSLTTTGGNAGE